MRIAAVVVIGLVCLGAVACGKSGKSERTLRKMDFHTSIDDRGRLRLELRLFDTKHELMPVTGAFTAEVAKLDGSVLCKAAADLAPTDFSDKGAYKADWHDAKCPADPGVEELRITVKVTLSKEKVASKDDGAKDAKDAKDAKPAKNGLERTMTVPLKAVYLRMPEKPPAPAAVPAAGSGSAAAPTAEAAEPPAAGSGSAGSGSAGSSAGSGSAATKQPPKRWKTGTAPSSAGSAGSGSAAATR